MKKIIAVVLAVILVATLSGAGLASSDGRKYIDIKPASCPNPLNVKSGGVLPVALLSSPLGFDVTAIDPATIRLEGVPPLRWNLEDVATRLGHWPEDCTDCTTAGPDGWMDMTFKFDKQAVVVAIGEVEDGDCIPLTLTGEFFDGRPIWGMDFVIIKKKGRNNGG